MRVKKHQMGGRVSGGSYSLPSPMEIPRTSVQTPVPEPIFFRPQKPEVDKSKFTKDIDITKLKGLDSDTKAAINKVQTAQMALQELSDLDILSQTDKFKATISELNASVTKINELERNKQQFEDSVDLLKANEGHSAALTIKGMVGVQDIETGKIGYISPYQYADAPDKYRVITGAEAINLREYSSPFDNTLTSALSTTYGLSNISSYINSDFISKLGSVERGNVSDSLQAIQELGMKAIVNGGYKRKDNFDAIQAGKNIAWKYLNEDQKTQLKVKAVQDAASKGLKFSDPKDVEMAAYSLIAEYFNKSIDDSLTTETRWKVSQSDLTGSRGPLAEATIGVWEMALSGVTNNTTGKVDITNLDGSTKLASSAVKLPGIVTKPTKLGDDQTTDKYAPFLQSPLREAMHTDRARTVSGQKIPQKLLGNMIVEEGQSYVTYAMVQDGKYVFDDETASKIKDAVNNEVEKIESVGRTVTPQLRETIENGIANNMKREKVIVTKGYIGDKNTGFEEIKGNLKEGVDYKRTNVDTDIMDKVIGAQMAGSGGRGAFNMTMFGGGYDQIVVVAPVQNMAHIRATLDNEKVYIPKSTARLDVIQGSAQQDQLPKTDIFIPGPLNTILND